MRVFGDTEGGVGASLYPLGLDPDPDLRIGFPPTTATLVGAVALVGVGLTICTDGALVATLALL